MTQEQVLDLAYKLVAMDENSWDGNIQDFLEENGAEYVPIIVSSGRNKGLPEFFDIAVDLKEGAAFLKKICPAWNMRRPLYTVWSMEGRYSRLMKEI